MALASLPEDREVDIEGLTVKTATAARVLRLHQEYVRELIRRQELKASKENGEYQIPLSEVMSYEAHSAKLGAGPSSQVGLLYRVLKPHSHTEIEMWRRPPEEPESGPHPA